MKVIISFCRWHDIIIINKKTVQKYILSIYHPYGLLLRLLYYSRAKSEKMKYSEYKVAKPLDYDRIIVYNITKHLV